MLLVCLLWTIYIFLSLPLVFDLGLHLSRHVWFSPASLSFSLFLNNIEITCTKMEISWWYTDIYLLSSGQILDTASHLTAVAEALVPAAQIPEAKSWSWWAFLVAWGFPFKSNSFAPLHRLDYKKTGCAKNSSHFNSHFGSFQNSAPTKQLDSPS